MNIRKGRPIEGVAIGILARRERLADREAKDLVGVLYSVLSLHVDRKRLKKAADWPGVIENISLALRRYADGEAGMLLAGQLPSATPFLNRRRAR